MLAIRSHSRAAPWQSARYVALRTTALLSVQIFRNSFRYALQTRQVHPKRVPVSGPPSYATIARRFSLQPNPVTFFNNKRVQEAIERGEFDIHDIGGVDPEDYDVLFTDVTDDTLQSEIAEIAGVPYLQKASEDEANEVVKVGHGFIYGKKLRTIFPCVVGLEGKAHWVFFIVDSGAPLTYLSEQTARVFGIVNDPITVTIAGHYHQVFRSPEHLHFSDVNILGADFCNASSLHVWPDYRQRTAAFYFGNKWEVKPIRLGRRRAAIGRSSQSTCYGNHYRRT